MTISEGDTIPSATFLRMGAEGPEEIALDTLAKGRRVVIFGLPGAYTGTCTTAHVPSFVRTMDGFAEKGVDDIICVAVNDPFVLQAWAAETGAAEAGIVTLADPEATFTKAVGMEFTAPPVGLIGRSKRYAMLVEDGRVVTLMEEEGPGVCDMTGGEALLATL